MHQIAAEMGVPPEEVVRLVIGSQLEGLEKAAGAQRTAKQAGASAGRGRTGSSVYGFS